MIRQGIKNYFVSLKYFFTPIGTIALCFIIGLSVFIPGCISAATKLTDDIVELFEASPPDLSALNDALASSVNSLDWTDPIDAVLTILDEEWLMATVTKSTDALLDGATVYTEQIGVAVSLAVETVTVYLVIFVLFNLLGLIASYFVTKKLVRSSIAKCALWKVILVWLFDAIITPVPIAMSVWLLSIWKPGAVISGIISLLLFGFIALLEAYLLHGLKKIPFTKIINIQNILKLFITDFLIAAIATLMSMLIFLITNPAIGIIVGLSLFEIAMPVISYGGESFVKQQADGNTLQAQDAPAVEKVNT